MQLCSFVELVLVTPSLEPMSFSNMIRVMDTANPRSSVAGTLCLSINCPITRISAAAITGTVLTGLSKVMLFEKSSHFPCPRNFPGGGAPGVLTFHFAARPVKKAHVMSVDKC